VTMNFISCVVATAVLCSVFGTLVEACDHYQCPKRGGGPKVCYLNGTVAGQTRCIYDVAMAEAGVQPNVTRPCDCGERSCDNDHKYSVCNKYNELIAKKSSVCLQKVKYCIRGEKAPALHKCETACKRILCLHCDDRDRTKLCYPNGTIAAPNLCTYQQRVCSGQAELGATTTCHFPCPQGNFRWP